MKPNPRILLPFNFTDACVAALRYASQFASHLSADLVLLHCAGETQLTPTFQSHLMSRLRSFTDRYMNSAGKSITRFCVVRGGSLRENLPSVVENHNVNLLIACPEALLEGNDQKEVLSLTDFASCPMLLVPREAVFQPLKEIVFSVDVTDTDAPVLERVQKIARKFAAHLTLLHLHGNLGALELCQIQKAASALQGQLTYPNATILCQEEEDLLEGLNDFSELYTPDLFVIATRDTHLLNEYFSGRYRKTSAYHLHTPLLNLYQARKTPCSGGCTHCNGHKQEQRETGEAVIL
ncbi:universal stress protein [Rufibacter sediminis]|uniref:Universal stress protein n=1 Tax=Rufibacter sediminis TaxID=2762756 RepID=A0ABR6VSG3_9BACT|nr:universal stress protein [Rufibacter sediminis]MBC3540104.1 universal stress protein [Rufibacter sediminis]